ncbi:CD3324 family protein [Paenibacillus ginsengarvi]|uniref:CD3324 family protein n=1 Tax=Paenibacillus ginsengarvi TaxID=400777 RepID=UPI0018759A13
MIAIKYENAGDVLPEHLLEEVKKYAAGKLLYIPLNNEKKGWGEVSGYRQFLVRRNQFILNKFLHGVDIRELSAEFFLSEETIKKIVYSKKNSNKLEYYPTIKSSMEYSEAGMLEEWIHTYLLFDRRNKVFSDGLRLLYRYYLGPILMPLSLFVRSSGPEAHMKWKVHPVVFENKVACWADKILHNEDTPPLIINFEEGEFEINCNNPLFEALRRAEVREYPVIIWISEKTSHELFLKDYSVYL